MSNANSIDEAIYLNEGLDRRQIKTKKAIIRSFIRLMEVKDISKITITELAKEADIDRKTFYLHFDSIQSVYNEIGNKIVEIVNKTISNYMNNRSSQTPYFLFLSINDILNEKLEFFYEAVKCEAFTEFIEKIKTAFCNELIKAYGKPGKEPSERFKLTAEFISSGTVSMYIRWLHGNSGLSMDELARLSGDMIIHGVAGIADQLFD